MINKKSFGKGSERRKNRVRLVKLSAILKALIMRVSEAKIKKNVLKLFSLLFFFIFFKKRG